MNQGERFGRFLRALEREAPCPRCGRQVSALTLSPIGGLCRRCCIETLSPWGWVDLLFHVSWMIRVQERIAAEVGKRV